MKAPHLALGFAEIPFLSITAVIADQVGKEKIGAAYVTVIVKGAVAVVKAAVEAGAHAVGTLGKLVAAHAIARPHDDLVALLPK